MKPKSELILYQTEDNRTRIEVRLENETVWLTQKLMAELFQTTPQNVTLHLKAIFAEGELAEAATCKDYLQVRSEGGREVTRKLRHYRTFLDSQPRAVDADFEKAVKELKKLPAPKGKKRRTTADDADNTDKK